MVINSKLEQCVLATILGHCKKNDRSACSEVPRMPFIGGCSMTLDHAYWHKRWQEGETGWHQAEISPSLRTHWQTLGLTGHEKVLVPFCGKSLDMLWLAEQGHQVLGVEFSRLPIEQFLDEHKLTPAIEKRNDGTHYRSGPVEIIEADIFQVDKGTLASCVAVYDRGALVAQNEVQRGRYLHQIYGRLPVGCRGLLLTIDYPQAEMDGPPFSVTAAELIDHLPEWQMDNLHHQDILAEMERFRQAGVTKVYADAWKLTRHS
jgi:thiopurine S-methyltransferase